MKKTVKPLLLCLAILTLLSVFALSVYAVPSYHKKGDEGACKSHTNKLVTLDDIADHSVTDNGARKIQKVNTTKNIPLVVIVIGFKNISYNNSYDWGDTIFECENSLKKYYSDMSFGQFTFEPVTETSQYGTGGNTNKSDKANDGVIHVKLDTDHDDWSLMQIDPILNWNNNFTMTKAFINAINKANAYINFKQYDDNGNGTIENNEMALGFIVAGNEAAYEETYNTFSFWSHAFSISEAIDGYKFNKLSVPVVDGVKVDSYIGIAERLDKNTQEPVNVLAHELGHYLGLPDLYDTVYSTSLEWSDYNVGFLSIMCSGMWCEDEENGTFFPASMDAWSRYELGWIKPTRVTANGTFELTSQDYDDTGKQIKTILIPTQTSNEYYIVENRQFTGWDRALGDYFDSDNGGVVIWHVDKNVYNKYYDLNQVNNTDHRPSVMPLYPEEYNSKYTFTGSGELIYSPFFTNDLWESVFKSTLGKKLNLPLYGKGNNADKRASRRLSGIGIEFLDNQSNSMNVFVDVDSHTHALVHKNSQPGCIAMGYNDCYYCTYCHKYFTDTTCTVEMSAAEVLIPAKGHNYKYNKTVKPTADEDGYDLYICENCAGEHKENFKKLVGWGKDKNGYWHYAKSEGVFVTGFQKLKRGDGKLYYHYFGNDGIMRTGFQKIKRGDGKTYFHYFGDNGTMRLGFQKIKRGDGKLYYHYFGDNGCMRTGWQKIKRSDGKLHFHYFGDNGCMRTGWQSIKRGDGKTYKHYFGTNGCMCTGWQTIGGKKYYFKDNGVMVTGNYKIGNKTYIFNTNGVCQNA